jgi:D-sedoheptulose 7-phosphate isomerase
VFVALFPITERLIVTTYTSPGGGNGTGAQTAAEYYSELGAVLSKLSLPLVDSIAAKLYEAFVAENTVFLFGNGGSAATASHFACDLGKGTASAHPFKRLRAHALTDNIPSLTAWANDSGYASIFAEQLRNFLRPSDLVVAISGSGNSPNVLHALELAKDEGAFCIGLTGFRGGKMASLCDLCLIVPSDNMQLIEDVHMTLAHAIYTILWNKIAVGSRVANAASSRA